MAAETARRTVLKMSVKKSPRYFTLRSVLDVKSPATSAHSEALRKATDQASTRAPPVEPGARAGGFSHLHISAVRTRHWGLPGCGYDSTTRFTQIYFMGNLESESAHNAYLLMRRTFCGARRSSPRKESSAMMIGSRPAALGTTSWTRDKLHRPQHDHCQ